MADQGGGAMTERGIAEIEEVLRAVPWTPIPLLPGIAPTAANKPDYPAMARAVVEQVVGPLDRRAADMWQEIVADRDARLARLMKAAEMIKTMFHPTGPGHGTCSMCRKAGGEHSGGCPIGLIVVALADVRVGKEEDREIKT